jgi:hypothetical protein
MSETKKKQIRKGIAAVEIALAAVLVIYLIYGVVTKNSNQLIFNILATILVAAAVVLNDIVEPYLTKVFEEMDEFRKEAYKKYVLWDAASWAGLLIFVFTFGSEDSSFMIISVVLYVIATRQKREYKAVAFGEITKKDVEFAKAAVVDAEAVEVEESAETALESEETIEE